jgi:hypothetical protein
MRGGFISRNLLKPGRRLCAFNGSVRSIISMRWDLLVAARGSLSQRLRHDSTVRAFYVLGFILYGALLGCDRGIRIRLSFYTVYTVREASVATLESFIGQGKRFLSQ